MRVVGAASQAEPAAPQLVRWLVAIAPPGVPWSGFEKSRMQASASPFPGSKRPAAVVGENSARVRFSQSVRGSEQREANYARQPKRLR